MLFINRDGIFIQAQKNTVTRTEFQECDGTFINEFSLEFDNHEYVCPGSLAITFISVCGQSINKQMLFVHSLAQYIVILLFHLELHDFNFLYIFTTRECSLQTPGVGINIKSL